MRENIVEMHCGEEVLLVGRDGTLSHLPPAIRDAERGSASLRRALASPENMRKLRQYWRLNFPSVTMSRCSDGDLLRMAEAAVSNRRLHVALLRRTWPHQPPPRQPGRKPGSSSGSSASPSSQLLNSGRHALEKTGAVMHGEIGEMTPSEAAARVLEDTQRPAADPVTSWSMERRFMAVVRMAVDKVPSEMRGMMAALLSPDSIALMIGLMAVAAAANLTPFGWAADAVILGIAYAAGGMIAVHAAGSLFQCFVTVQNANTKEDLEYAAELLAGAIVEIGVIGLMAILHRFSKGSEGDAGDMKAVEKPTRRSVEEQRIRRPRSSSSEGQKVHKKPPVKEETPRPSSTASERTMTAPNGKKIGLPKPGSMSNKEVREWYVAHDSKIPELIDRSAPLETQAHQAWSLRNSFRSAAREAMADREAAAALDATRPNLTWEQTVAKYSGRHSGDDLWNEIIGAAQRSNADVNKALGVKPPGGGP